MILEKGMPPKLDDDIKRLQLVVGQKLLLRIDAWRGRQPGVPNTSSGHPQAGRDGARRGGCWRQADEAAEEMTMDFTPQSKKRMLIGLQQQTEAWGISLQESNAEGDFQSGAAEAPRQMDRRSGDPAIDHPEAIRRLVELGLKAKK